MMFLHPLFKTLVTRPELLAEHAGAYLELASAEAAEAALRLRLRCMLAGAALLCAALALVLGGMALLLLAVLPLDQMPAPWALAAAPAVPLVGAIALWLAQRRHALDLSFGLVREQFALDRQLLQKLSRPRPSAGPSEA
ncbi:MAG: hypothetical protein LCI02_06435 [Proteobacteria bacterium]|nr:hypothetical protein [Pseudomonadota bacterium]